MELRLHVHDQPQQGTGIHIAQLALPRALFVAAILEEAERADGDRGVIGELVDGDRALDPPRIRPGGGQEQHRALRIGDDVEDDAGEVRGGAHLIANDLVEVPTPRGAMVGFSRGAERGGVAVGVHDGVPVDVDRHQVRLFGLVTLPRERLGGAPPPVIGVFRHGALPGPAHVCAMRAPEVHIHVTGGFRGGAGKGTSAHVEVHDHGSDDAAGWKRCDWRMRPKMA
mmetsp:Transcript_94802/g.272923  ORF Transcript_94802/g.272923 Transcript_94802/m.272923 type:complete len:226 (-) Transcript_94802:7-684(-)